MGGLFGTRDLYPDDSLVSFFVLLTAGCFVLLATPITLWMSLQYIRRWNWRRTAANPDPHRA
jgi:hypothetical protein